MASGSETAPTPAPAKTPTPARTYTHIGFIDYARKELIKPILASLASYAAVYLTLRSFTKERWKSLANPIGYMTGAAVGFFTAFNSWGKTEKKRIGINDILTFYEADPPAKMKAQLEQNDRIQQRIREITAATPPRSHQEALNTPATDQQMVRY